MQGDRRFAGLMSIVVLAFLAVTASPPSSSGRNPAIEAFREACVEGSLTLSRSRGRILKGNEITDFVRISDGGRSNAQRTVVKLNAPPSTYLVITEYGNLQKNSIARSCALVSGSLTTKEAMYAFLDGLPVPKPRPAWWPDLVSSNLVADYPERGFRKSIRFRNDGSVVLTVGIYANVDKRNSRSEQKRP
jgi:hypothetical protein